MAICDSEKSNILANGLFASAFLNQHVDPVGLSVLITLAPLFNVASSDAPADPEFKTVDEDGASNL